MGVNALDFNLYNKVLDRNCLKINNLYSTQEMQAADSRLVSSAFFLISFRKNVNECYILRFMTVYE